MKAESAATVLQVSDLAESKKYYIEVLGFEFDFEYGDYAGLKTGNVSIHLAQVEPGARNLGPGSMYIFCDEVGDYYNLIVGRGSETTGEPKKTPYGMHDFQAVDPDGNLIGFGCQVE